jgi:hypothetical protein
MKKGKVFALGMWAAALTFGLILAGCSHGGGDPDPEFSLSGSFGGTGGGQVHFDLESEEDLLSASVMRAVGDDGSYPLNGVLQDGTAPIERLQGYYDPIDGSWSVSARSGDNVVYTIDGMVGNAGAFLGAGATIVKSVAGNEWAPSFSPATETGAWNLGAPQAGTAYDMPSSRHGYWIGAWEGDVSGLQGEKIFRSLQCLISGWKIKVTGTETYTIAEGSIPIDQNQTIIEVNEVGDTYEVISCYPEYKPDAEKFAAALTEYLGLSAGDITYYNSYSPELTGRWVYMDTNDLAPVCGGDFTDADYKKMVEFYAVNGWETWATKNNVTPAKKYAKYKFVFAGDNGSFDMIQMIGGQGGGTLAPMPHLNTYAFDTLQELKDATLYEEHKWYIKTISAPPQPEDDLGVLAIRFTRR